MTIRKIFKVVCTRCSRYQCEDSGDDPEEAREVATLMGWKCAVLVPNGSLWDYCPACVAAGKHEE